MLEKLIDKESWDAFLSEKLNNEYLSIFDKNAFKRFIEGEKYLEICKGIVDGAYVFSTPKKHVISKNASSKRRIVYSFNKDEMMIMKYISYLLYEYDYMFSPNLYSFRQNTGVKKAIRYLNKQNTKKMYGYKLDISNYFNSINTNAFIKEIDQVVDKGIVELYKKLYKSNEVIYRNKIIEEEKGAMAGVPLSAFAANFYIKNIDKYFFDNKILYLRYADDIIIFTSTKEDIDRYSKTLKNMLLLKGLKVNEDKESHILPGEKFEFLGFSFDNGIIDIAPHSVYKIKAKIKRQARKLRRWAHEKNLTPEKSLVAINKKFNKKFYGKSSDETSWTYWFFPIINTTRSLKVVDTYMQQEQRYIYTGKHNKMNYKKCSYEKLKEHGYKSLVHEYYKFKSKDKE